MGPRIALLRAVNLPGHKRVAMAGLRAMLTGLGLHDVRSLLQSGNLVFRSDLPAAKLETLLETQARKQLGLDTEFMVRTSTQWDAIIERNPFPEQARSDPAHLVVMACKASPGANPKTTGVKRELVRAGGREVYIYYPDGIGRSRLKIDAVGTARNWNTVLKLRHLAKA
jgi:uncharacterized protein (DUF1697 family)